MGSDPPVSIIQTESRDLLLNYLRKNSVVRGGFEPGESESRVQLPAVSVPGYLHLALSQLASHRLTPYAGNVSAMIRDLVYLGAGAYAQIIDEYEKQNGNGTEKNGTGVPMHVVRQEEALRRDLFIAAMGVGQAFSFIGAGAFVDLARRAGDSEAVFDQFWRLFNHIDGLPGQLWRYQALRLVYGMPELREALAWLQNQPKYQSNQDVEGWTSRLDDVAEQGG